jgi:glucose-6-phosphate dehydrogenase assembly protein OpcA
LIHLRCEVSAANVLEHFADFKADGQVRLASLMDHAPGQRQFQTMEQYTLFYKTKRGLSDEAFAHFVARRQEASARYSAQHRKTKSRAPARSAASPLPAMTTPLSNTSRKRPDSALNWRNSQPASTLRAHRTKPG